MNQPSAIGFSLSTAILGAISGYANAAPVNDIRSLYGKVLEEQLKEITAGSSFSPELVHLVDHDSNTGNFLFRGNMPISNKAFSYQQLVAAMRNASPGVPLPDKVYLIDVSLVNSINPAEAADLKIEQGFWQQNPTLGKLINHPVYGSITSPNDYPSALRKRLEKIPTISRIDDLVVDLQALLKMPQMSGVTLAIYVHCEAGKDRTGEVAAAYAMKYLGSSYAKAYANANAIAKRAISQFSRNELQWYAYYLKDVRKVPSIGPIN
ncbi:hypothetical protein ACVW0Y_003305 [Pseudomonas sp. TE3786]